MVIPKDKEKRPTFINIDQNVDTSTQGYSKYEITKIKTVYQLTVGDQNKNKNKNKNRQGSKKYTGTSKN